jgi:uncharacterized RDD family membrane protein YckC
MGAIESKRPDIMEVWIGRQGERLGPYRDEDVRQWLREGKIRPDDLAWHEGLTDWQPLSTLFPEDAAAAPEGSSPPLPPALPVAVAAAGLSRETYAGFWRRAAALIIDSLIMLIPSVAINYSMGLYSAQALVTADPGSVVAMQAFFSVFWSVMLVQTLMQWIYFAAFESSALQATPGKMALGLRVTDDQGKRLSFLRATGRFFGKTLSGLILCVGYMMAGWTERKQALHDMIASTLVLNGRAGIDTTVDTDDKTTLHV